MKPRKLMGMWLDTSKAVLVTLEGKKSDVRTLQSGIETHERVEGETDQSGRFGNQFVEDERAKDNRIREMEGKFLGKLIKEVSPSDQLFVFGPAHMKTRFEKLFAETTGQKPNLRAVEAADSMTENQIAAKVKEFFGKDSGLPAGL